mmetsp:Transcript_22152/g.51090  ORF Transcript_22152/g.51090 Transcript_22152/m.51090 type:complete len:166 (-) Transcript_22152:98-595(-)
MVLFLAGSCIVLEAPAVQAVLAVLDVLVQVVLADLDILVQAVPAVPGVLALAFLAVRVVPAVPGVLVQAVPADPARFADQAVPVHIAGVLLAVVVHPSIVSAVVDLVNAGGVPGLGREEYSVAGAGLVVVEGSPRIVVVDCSNTALTWNIPLVRRCSRKEHSHRS